MADTLPAARWGRGLEGASASLFGELGPLLHRERKSFTTNGFGVHGEDVAADSREHT